MSSSESKIKNKWLVILNPNAGQRKAEKDWKKISALLKEAGFDYHVVFTEHRHHAMHLAEDYFNDGYNKVIVIGGDGTINEVANGIFRQTRFPTTDITIGMITMGTGNDWGRMYHIPEKYKKTIKVLKQGKTFIQDAGLVTYHQDGRQQQRYFVNMAGMGYDALVAQKTNAMKDKGGGGPLTYMYNLVASLFQYKLKRMGITIDGENAFTGLVYTMSVGICKYNGGGMMQLPPAVPDDGLLDITIIKNATRWMVVKNIKNLFDGSFVKLPVVEQFIGKTVKIESLGKEPVFMEADGESLGHSPLTFELIPQSIKLIVKKGWDSK